MTIVDVMAILKFVEPAVPMILKAIKAGQPVETIFALNTAALDTAFASARSRKARRRPPQD